MFRWVFLDVGNVILNDDPCMALIYRILFDLIREAGHDVTFPQLLAEREELVLVHNDGRHHWTLARRYIGEEGRQRMHEAFHRAMEADFLRYNVEMAGVRDILSELRSRHHLAVASNHGPSCRPALEESGLIDYFDLVGISIEMGLEKPDSAFFRTLLGQAGCAPGEAVMRGSTSRASCDAACRGSPRPAPTRSPTSRSPASPTCPRPSPRWMLSPPHRHAGQFRARARARARLRAALCD
jgi:5'-nucleotidase